MREDEHLEASFDERNGDDGDYDFIIHTYSLEQALEDGVLVELWREQWPIMSGGLPIVATAAVVDTYDNDVLKGIWEQFVSWRIYVMPTLPEEDQMFTTEVEHQTVWILEDGTAVTILRPEDY